MPEAFCPLEEAAKHDPGATAIISGKRALSFIELRDAVVASTGWMHALGIRAGDTIAFPATPDAQTITLLLSCIRLGAIACPVNTRLPAEAFRNALVTAGTTHLIGRTDHSSGAIRIIEPECLAEAAPRAREIITDLPVERPAVIVFTSGSVGEPKAALLSLRNLVANATASNRNIVVNPGDGWLLSLPLCHVSGLGILFRCLLAHAAVVLPDSDASLAESLAGRQVTHLSLVATQLYRLLEDEISQKRLRQLKAILLGGSAIPAALVEKAFALGLKIHTTYGLTEMASQVTTTRPGEILEGLRTSGHPLSAGNSKLSHDNEICVHGETLFLGYRVSHGFDLQVDSEGWFHTGDLGHWDNAGRLVVEGRKDNRFVCGGENVQPEETERCLLAIEGIEQAIVVPVNDPEYGQIPVAFLQCAPGFEKGIEAAPARLRESLPGFKTPKRILPWPSQLATSERKPDRKALARYAEDLLNS